LELFNPMKQYPFHVRARDAVCTCASFALSTRMLSCS
jgi:hypothetical protein